MFEIIDTLVYYAQGYKGIHHKHVFENDILFLMHFLFFICLENVHIWIGKTKIYGIAFINIQSNVNLVLTRICFQKCVFKQ